MMTYVTVYKFDCCSRKNALDFLTNVLKDLHSLIFSVTRFFNKYIDTFTSQDSFVHKLWTVVQQRVSFQ